MSADLDADVAALREQFVAVPGHDLRNPLAAIDAGMRLLLESSQEEKALRTISLVQSSTLHMATLIDNVLDFARGRLGDSLGLQRDADGPLEPVLTKIIEELRAVSPGRVIQASFALIEPMNCGRTRIGRLFSNLLGNALTHGAPDRPIRVQAVTSDHIYERSVASGGESIPDAELEHLFQPFFVVRFGPASRVLGLASTSRPRLPARFVAPSMSPLRRLKRASRYACRWIPEQSFVPIITFRKAAS